MVSKRLLTLPNTLCLLRLALAPVLLLVAWQGRESLFVPVLAAAFLLDTIDGPIARRYHMESELGPRLDSIADTAIYLSLPLGIWWLWPDLILSEAPYVAIIVAAVLLPTIAGLIKFRTVTSYHTWLVKAAAVVTALSTLWLLLGGPSLPFRIASFVCLAAGLEEMIITLVLDRPRSDVRSLFHMLRRND